MKDNSRKERSMGSESKKQERMSMWAGSITARELTSSQMMTKDR